MSPVFLNLADVIQLHADQVEAFGGSRGIRDANLLASAVAQASMTFGGSFLHEDLFAMAAAYLFHIAMNHTFIDGNKRTGLAAAVVFLDLNGFTVPESSTERLYEAAMAVAEGRMGKATLAEALRGLAFIPPSSGG